MKGDGSRSGAELSEIEVLKKRNRELEIEVEILSDASQSSAEEVKTLSNLRWNYKLKMEESEDSFLSKIT